MTVSAVILAAGEGTRMRSSRPKPLHMICGRAMVMHVIYALEQVGVERTVIVVGHGAERVRGDVAAKAPSWAHVEFVEQIGQHGTGDATQYGLSVFPGDDMDDRSTVLVLPGDTPLLRPETLDALVAEHVAQENAATLLTSELDDPTGYGRIVRAPAKSGRGRVLRIVEQRDASPEELAIKEWNTGIYAFRRDLLGPALRRLSPDNSQGEYYLTDVIASLARMGHPIDSITAPAEETQGVNDRWQLALAERELRNRTNRHWLLNGVTMLDPRQTFVDVTVRLGRDVTLYPGTLLHGSTTVADGAQIGPSTRLIDCAVGADAVVEYSVGRGATIPPGAHVGPFASV
ncbi:MAG TPA: NTP transferase domain-containing protein [Ilumatobacteraceae bacterium]|nr:NTP transferase domain-containing protein [Ilumatobacteraceae bacterium]